MSVGCVLTDENLGGGGVLFHGFCVTRLKSLGKSSDILSEYVYFNKFSVLIKIKC